MAACRRMLYGGIVLGLLITYTWMHDASHENPEDKYLPQFQDEILDLPHYQEEVVDSEDSDRNIIIWWTGRLFIRREMSVLKCAGNVECAVTKKRSYLKDPRTRGFIFYGSDFTPEDLPLPRKPHHEWGFVHEESPMNNQMLSHAVTLQYFNHSCTFRRESDFPITTHSLESLEYLTRRMPVDIKLKNQYRKEGLAPLAFVQSHCNVASDREVYILELMKYINVDSYGACLHNKDLPEELRDPVKAMFDEQFLDIMSKYKFILAFENALCDDFITEKLWRVFHIGVVPVYRGARTARDWIPNQKSIIMTDDFKSPEELAKFIHELDVNDDKYEEYLSYKKTGIKNALLTSVMEARTWGLNHDYLPFFLDRFECHVCEKVNERVKAEREGRVMESRTVPYNHIGCPQPVEAVPGAPRPPADHVNWTRDYWSSLDKSRAMQLMIDSGETDSQNFDSYWDRVLRDTDAR